MRTHSERTANALRAHSERSALAMLLSLSLLDAYEGKGYYRDGEYSGGKDLGATPAGECSETESV